MVVINFLNNLKERFKGKKINIKNIEKQYKERLSFLERLNVLSIINKDEKDKQEQEKIYKIKLTFSFSEELRKNLFYFLEKINITDSMENQKIPYSFLSLAITETYFSFLQNIKQKIELFEYEFDLYIINNILLNMPDILEPFDLDK